MEEKANKQRNKHESYVKFGEFVSKSENVNPFTVSINGYKKEYK